MLAVLEHLSYPRAIVAGICRVLKPGGRSHLTVPSKAAKPVPRNPYILLSELISPTGLEMEAHHYFQLGMNNLLICRKNKLRRSTNQLRWRVVCDHMTLHEN
jgi:ubiquinone/menaquinone biosynthesis C-methylase UbiE